MPAERRTVSNAKFDAALAAGVFDGNPYLPILKAVRDGKIQHMSVFQQAPGERAVRWRIEQQNCVISIGDDLDLVLGPEAFHRGSLVRAIRQCIGVVLQVANFRPDVMAGVAIEACRGPVMIIETGEEREIEWAKFLKEFGCPPKPPLLWVTVKQQMQ